MSQLQGTSFIATGTIQPARFVSMDTTGGNLFSVIQSVLNDTKIIGISQPGSEDAPGTTGAASDAARSGASLQVYGPGDVCLLEIGAGGITAGDWLESDANGKGITASLASATAVYYGAKALETAAASEKARVVVVLGAITGT